MRYGGGKIGFDAQLAPADRAGGGDRGDKNQSRRSRLSGTGLRQASGRVGIDSIELRDCKRPRDSCQVIDDIDAGSRGNERSRLIELSFE